MNQLVRATTLLLLMSSPSFAQVVLDGAGQFGPEPSSEVRTLTFEVPEDTAALGYVVNVKLNAGRASVRFTDSSGEKRIEFGTGGSMRVPGRIRTRGRTGTWKVELVSDKAVGNWTVQVATSSDAVSLALYLLPGQGMIVAGVVALLLWRWQSRAKWRWFWVGAGVWFVGVALKVVFALLLNQPILEGIKWLVPNTAYLLLGSLYIGLLTGVFEIGVTLVAALIWWRMADDAARGMAVGVGAGAFEAILVGVASIAAVPMAFMVEGSFRDQLFAQVEDTARTTLLWWLVPSVERVIAILCHTSSRGLLLWGVARRRWFWPFVVGFAIMTAIDTVAGYVHLAGLLGKVSVWWIEAALAPAAVLSIPIIVWCYRTWPLLRQGEPDGVEVTSEDQ